MQFLLVPGGAACMLPSVTETLLFQLLARLLKSKNPDDLQEANRLIKSMVKEVSAWALVLGARGTGFFPRDLRPIFFPCTSSELLSLGGALGFLWEKA